MAMYAERIASLVDRVGDVLSYGDAREVLEETLTLMAKADDVMGKTTVPGMYREDFRATVEPALVDLVDILTKDDTAQHLVWAREVLTSMQKVVDGLIERESALADDARARAKLSQTLGEGAQRAAKLLDDHVLNARLAEATRRAEDAASAAQQAAGDAGSGSLAEHFEKYAQTELRSSNAFRIATMSLIGVATALAFYLGEAVGGDWAGIAWRASLLAGAGTLSAYFARLGGQHRRNYNWAKSVAVQLLSFPAFITPVPEEERAEIYRSFSLRVLGAPPEKGSGGSDGELPVSQVLDIVTTMAKRAGN